MAKRYWLMKSEPSVYSIDDLHREGVACWDGVRNYQARNTMRDDMAVGDGVLFYHSSADPPGVAGVARVARRAYPDHTAFDPRSPYHDPKSSPDDPRWLMVDVEFVERFPGVVPLSVLQQTPGLEDMVVTKKGMRLSVQPVTAREWDIVLALGRAAKPADDAPARKPAPARKKVPARLKKAPAKKKAARSSTKAPAKKAPARSSTKAPAKKAPASAKKAPASATKAPARSSKKTPAQKTPARSSRKAPAKKAPARKRAAAKKAPAGAKTGASGRTRGRR